jgi:hypothetical protein
MMLNKGTHGRECILSRPSVEVMTTDQLTPAQRAATGILLGDNRGWGFGMSVIIRRDDLSATPGRFGWVRRPRYGLGIGPRGGDGGDPDDPACHGFPSAPALYSDFWALAYQAIDD